MKNITVIFKTHLDVGYTDLAAAVTRQYMRDFIPAAITTGEKILAAGRPEGFVWTTGSWLIHRYLEQANEAERERCENAIRTGLLRWHALPFTMHSEAAGADLFAHGLTLSQDLDKRFDMNTIAAKCTDVPGHSIGIVPILAQAGVKMLHVGTNGGCVPPDVPIVPVLPSGHSGHDGYDGSTEHDGDAIFVWRSPDGAEIIVVYNDGYGGFVRIPGTDEGFYFAHSLDNIGPPAFIQAVGAYTWLRHEYPGAEIKAGTLDDMAGELLKIKDSLPVLSSEIGDTWIHGVASDPQKMSRFRSLLRLAEGWDEGIKRKAYKHLLMIPEHTWGLDEKSYLNDRSHYSRADFERLRERTGFVKMESSWREQRAYLDAAVAALPEPQRTQAEAAGREWKIAWPDLSAYRPLEGWSASRSFTKNGWTVCFDASGAVSKLEKDGMAYADESHRLAVLEYQVSSEADIAAYIARYCAGKDGWWLWEDFGKPGLPAELTSQVFRTECTGIYENDDEFILTLATDAAAVREFGFPARLILKVSLSKEKALFDLAWFEKPALRIPESFWWGFNPFRPLSAIRKLGRWIDPRDVVSGGGREMHAIDGPMDFDGIILSSLDAPVVAVDRPATYAFYDRIPACTEGVWLNLYNNQWGTNFPMWYEDDARFRVEVGVSVK